MANQNYKRLIFDAHESTKFLMSSLTLNQQGLVLEVVRNNILFKERRGDISKLIRDTLQKSMETEQAGEEDSIDLKHIIDTHYHGDLFKFSEEAYQACQILLEFMDKGMKGLLTGDLSVFAIPVIMEQIQIHQKRIIDLENELKDLMGFDSAQNVDHMFQMNQDTMT